MNNKELMQLKRMADSCYTSDGMGFPWITTIVFIVFVIVYVWVEILGK